LPKQERTLQIGSEVGNGQYIISAWLGAGAFGDVFKATHKQTRQEVAVKVEPLTAKHPSLIYEAKLCERLPQNGEACLWEMPSYRTRGAIAGEEMDLAMLPTMVMIGVAELSPIGTTTMALTGAELAITIDMVEDLMMALKFKAILLR